MKNVFIKVFAALLLVWYSMSIIGFDVHTCSGSGRSFVVTFVDGLRCSDIHPDHVCDKNSCCGAKHSECCSDHSSECGETRTQASCSVSPQSCCSNDYQVLTLTGTAVSQDNHLFEHCFCGHCLWVMSTPCEVPAVYDENTLISSLYEPDSGFITACDMQAGLMVWRI